MALALLPHRHDTTAQSPHGAATGRTPAAATVIIAVVRSVVFGATALLVLAAGLVRGISGDNPTGHRALVVTSGSMAPEFGAGDLLIVRTTRAGSVGSISPGAVITFRAAGTRGRLVTHRVQRVETDAAGLPVFFTKGDANAAADATPVRASDVVGTVSAAVPRAGGVLTALGDTRTLVLFLMALALCVLAGALMAPCAARPGAGHDPDILDNHHDKGAQQ